MLQTHFWQTTIIFLAQAHQIEKSDRFENWVVNSVKMSSFRTFETPGPGRCLGRGWVSYFMSGSSDILTRRRKPDWGGNTRSIETFSRTPLWTIIRISLVRSHGAVHKPIFTYFFHFKVKSAFMLSWAQMLSRDRNVTHVVKGTKSTLIVLIPRRWNLNFKRLF